MNCWRIPAVLLVVVSAVVGCASHPTGHGWTTLIDGVSGLENFNRLGDANWRAEGDAVVADKGKGGHLVTKNSYRDFEIYAEFWADHTTNSGIFIRSTDRSKIGTDSAYEANIYDQRSGPEYATGSIVGFATVPANFQRAGGKWNVMEIYAKGPEITVKLNGNVTASTRNDKFAAGPFSLQFGGGDKAGAIRWRKVMVKQL